MAKPKPIFRRFMSSLEFQVDSDCWIWTGAVNGNGYGTISAAEINRGQRSRYSAAHRLSYSLFRGPIPNGALICHKCDNPLCVNPLHLFVSSHSGNAADRNRKLRQAHGVRNGGARLSENGVRVIRASNYKVALLAFIYSVSPSTIYRARSGKSWSHLDG